MKTQDCLRKVIDKVKDLELKRKTAGGKGGNIGYKHYL